MLRRTVCLLCFVVVLGLVGNVSAAVPEGTILIGWHSPEIAAPANDSTPDDNLPGVVGLLSGGYDVQNKNSTDGTYGSGPATPASTVNAVRVRLDQPTRAYAFVTITNNTGSSLYLGIFHFDYGRWYGDSPKDVALYYDHGDLSADPNTLIGSALDVPVSGPSGNYSDFDYSLSVLNDVVLENSQSATFRLVVSNAAAAATAGGLDNIAITAGISATKASSPVPDDMLTNTPREVVLSWTPGESAQKHDVYFGSSFADVDGATSQNPMGSGQIYRARQAETSYAIPERLDFGRTYYWRIDEVNAPPSSTVYKGDVWSFTTEPYAYPVRNITVTASSQNKAVEGPENTINGSGLDTSDLHSYENTTMWLSSSTDLNPAWIQYEFDRACKLNQMLVWNYNSTIEPQIGFGIREASIEYSADGVTWAAFGSTFEFAQGPGADGYACNTTIDLGGVVAKYIKITALSNWGGILKQYGLSEVRFLYLPVWAAQPGPGSGATDVDVNTMLSFKAGREAATHNLYLSTDQQAVIDGTVPAAALTNASYSTQLNLGSTYYWRVDEVNDVETPTTWPGEVWSFSTQPYLVVDDFESYNDVDPPDPQSHRIFESWIDGFGVATNGALVGNDPPQPSYAEIVIVHSGRQAMPLFYSNTAGAAYSEAAQTFTVPQDWTKYGVKTLGLYFFGTAGNTGQLYAKINGLKIPYDGEAVSLARPGWQPWNIDLTALGLNLQSIRSLAIGIDGNGAAGTLYIDSIRLYAFDRQIGTPTDPGTAGLQAYYQFEGNTADSSGNQRNGTTQGQPAFAAGKTGQALSFDGVDDYVSITGYKGIPADASGIQQPFTITAWVNSIDSGDRTMVSWGTITNTKRVDFRLYLGSLRIEHGSGYVLSRTVLNDGNWHPVAVTVNPGATVSYPAVKLWLDGNDDTIASTDPDAFSITADLDVTIGCRITSADRFFLGSLDEIRIYDRVLSQEEITWLAGRSQPFDKPF